MGARRSKPLWLMAAVLSASCAGEIASPADAAPEGGQMRARKASLLARVSDLEVRVHELRKVVADLGGAEGDRAEVLTEVQPLDAVHSLENDRSPETAQEAPDSTEREREIQRLPLRFRLDGLSKTELREKMADPALGPQTKIAVLKLLAEGCDASQAHCLDPRTAYEVVALLERFNGDGEFHQDMLDAMGAAKDASVRDATLTFLVGGLDARSRRPRRST